MKYSYLALTMPVFFVSCMVHDKKQQEDSDQTPDLPVETVTTVIPEVSLSLTVDSEQIYMNERVKLSWTSENAKNCVLKVNGTDELQGLGLTGSNFYSPSEDTSFEVSCVSEEGKAVSKAVTVVILPDENIFLSFPTVEAFKASLDVEPILASCPTCSFAEFGGKFTRDADGIYTGTEAFAQEMQPYLTQERPKVVLLDSKTSSFSLESTLVHGHRDALNSGLLSAQCVARFPMKSGTPVYGQASFKDALEDGQEELSPEVLPNQFVSDLQVSGFGARGVVRENAELTVSYKVSALEASRSASFTDFDKAAGVFKLDSEGKLIDSEARDRQFWRLPSNGYIFANITDANQVPGLLMKPTQFGYLGVSNQVNPSQLYCSEQVPYAQYCEREPEGFLVCQYFEVKTFDKQPGYSKAGSPRVISGPSAVSCNQRYPALAGTLGLGNEWQATASVQYFVTDSRFKNGCNGMDCASKEPRNGPADHRFPEIEPAQNRCVDRWQGLDWASYENSLKVACESTAEFKNAYAIFVANGKNEDFAKACNEVAACASAVEGMEELSRISVSSYETILKNEAEKIENAKDQNISYLISDSGISPSQIAAKKEALEKLKNGLEQVQALHVAKSSQWMGGNKYISGENSLPGFDSYEQAKASIPLYGQIIAKAEELNKIEIETLGCNFDVKGRIRSYNELDLPLLKLKPMESKVYKTKAEIQIEAN